MALEPVTLQQQKDWMRVTETEDDAQISLLITAAREYVEEFCGLRLMYTTETDYREQFDDEMELAKLPLSSVPATGVVYIDTAGTTQTLSASVYDVDTVPKPGLIRLAYGQTWPSHRQVPKAITITYVAGYGAAADSVPGRAKTAIMMLAAHWYEHREAAVDGKAPQEVPLAVQSLLWLLRVPRANG